MQPTAGPAAAGSCRKRAPALHPRCGKRTMPTLLTGVPYRIAFWRVQAQDEKWYGSDDPSIAFFMIRTPDRTKG